MKRKIIHLMLLLLFVTLIVSCKKEEENTGIAPADSSIAKYLFDATKDEVDQHLNLQNDLNGFDSGQNYGPRNSCASLNITPLGLSFPKTVTIVFPQGCSTFAGADIEGTVVITISGKIREAGTTASFTLSDFKYKNYILSGEYAITFNGNNSHKTVISNGKVITPAGKTITYEATNTSMQIDGLTTTFKTNPLTFLRDDVYSINTISSGINSKGNKFSITTSKNLKYRVSCQWITEGIINISEESKPNISAFIDYGEDICDNKALLTVNNLTTTITLP